MLYRIKGIAVILLCFVLLLAGCSSEDNASVSEETWEALTDVSYLYNSEKQILDTLEMTSILHYLDGGIVYSNSFQGSLGGLRSEYYYYSFTDNTSRFLGEHDNARYVASDYVYLDNCIYFLPLFGEISEEGMPRGELWKIDLSTYEMCKLTEEENMNPHSLMEAVNGKLWLYVLRAGGSTLIEYDPTNGEKKTLAELSFDDVAVKGTAVRKITADDSSVTFLLAEFQSEEDMRLVAETYDFNFDLISSVDVSFVSDDISQKRNTVKTFDIVSDCIYYQNNSVTRYFGTIKGENICDGMELTKAFENAEGAKKDLFYAVDDEGYLTLYLFDFDTKTFKSAKLTSCGKDVKLPWVFRDSQDYLLISVNFQDQTTAKWTKERYYFNMSELVFE